MCKYIVFSTFRPQGATRGFVGGYADRLKGVVFTYALSVILNRRFLIDWHDYGSVKIQNWLEPNVINWIPFDLFYNSKDVNRFDLIDFKFKSAAEFDEFISQLLLCDSEFIVINANSLNYDFLKDSNFVKKDIFSYLITVQNFVSYVFNLLFDSSKLLNCNEFTNFQNFKSGNQFIVGIQFRTGGDGDWIDPKLGDVNDVEMIGHSVINKFKNNKFSCYITSDSKVARRNLFDFFKNKNIECFYYDFDPVHIERSKDLLDEQLRQVLLDHITLSKCDSIVIGRGQFGLTAAYVGNKPAINFYHV